MFRTLHTVFLRVSPKSIIEVKLQNAPISAATSRSSFRTTAVALKKANKIDKRLREMMKEVPIFQQLKDLGVNLKPAVTSSLSYTDLSWENDVVPRIELYKSFGIGDDTLAQFLTSPQVFKSTVPDLAARFDLLTDLFHLETHDEKNRVFADFGRFMSATPEDIKSNVELFKQTFSSDTELKTLFPTNFTVFATHPSDRLQQNMEKLTNRCGFNHDELLQFMRNSPTYFKFLNASECLAVYMKETGATKAQILAENMVTFGLRKQDDVQHFVNVRVETVEEADRAKRFTETQVDGRAKLKPLEAEMEIYKRERHGIEKKKEAEDA